MTLSSKNKWLGFWVGLALLSVLLSVMFSDDARAGDFQLSGEKVFATTTEADASLGIPRWKAYLRHLNANDTSVWKIELGNNIYFSYDAGLTYPDTVKTLWSGGAYHGSLHGAGDSLVVSKDINEMMIISGTTKRTKVTIPNQSTTGSIYNNVIIDTAGDDKIFCINRKTSPVDSNIRADITGDGGSTWTRTTPINNPAVCRMGGFPWIGGHPVVFEISGSTSGYGANYVRWDGSSWVTDACSNICPNTYFDASLNNRAFTINGLISGSDTLLFFCWPGLSANNFKCRWKRFLGGTGSWNEVTLSSSSYTTNALWECTSTIINGKFLVFYKKKSTSSDADYRLYMRYFVSGPDTFSTELQVSDVPYIKYPNSCQNAFCRRGFVFFENSNTNEFYTITVADTTGLGCSNDGYSDVISSLPFYVTTSYNGANLGIDCEADSADLTTTGNAIIFSSDVHDVSIDLRGRTLYFGTNGNSVSHYKGVSTSAAIGHENYSIEIRNGRMENAPTAGWEVPTVVVSADIFQIAHMNNVLIDNVDMVVRGRESRAAYISCYASTSTTPDAYDIEIKNCTIYDSCFSFLTRTEWVNQVPIMVYDASRTREGQSYHLYLHDNVINSFWSGIRIEGDSSQVIVEDNQFYCDGRNDLTPTNGGGANSNCTENYPISIGGDGHQTVTAGQEGCKIRVSGNTITAGSVHSGCRGVFLGSSEGALPNDTNNSIAILNNTMYLQNGPDGYVPNGNCMGIIIRERYRNVTVIGNNIHIDCQTTPLVSYRGNFGAGLRIEPTGVSYSAGPPAVYDTAQYPVGSGLRVVRNHIVAHFNGSWTPNYGSSGAVMTSAVYLDEYVTLGVFSRIDSNYFASDGQVIRLGGYNGGMEAKDSLQFFADTLAYYESSGDYTIAAGRCSAKPTCNGVNDPPIYFTDCIYQEGASADDLFAETADSWCDQFGLRSTLDITVVDPLSNLISGAYVYAVNAYGDTVMRDTSDALGKAGKAVIFRYEDNGNCGGSDSTGYNDFTVGAKYLGNSSDSSLTVSPTSKSAVIEVSVIAPPTTNKRVKGILR